MIFSRWNPVQGGYDYFEGGKSIPLGDDLPKPRLSQSSPIGVASIDAGRSLSPGAEYVGSGPLARGQITPISRNSLGVLLPSYVPRWAVVALAGFFAGWWAKKKNWV